MEVADQVPCTKCNGFRPISHFGDGKCNRCGGTGQIRKLGRPKYRTKCPRCNGTGLCPGCKGFGSI